MQSKRITISLDPDRFSALRSMSQRTGDTIAMVVRKAIDAIDTGGEERPDPAAPATSGPGGAVEAASGEQGDASPDQGPLPPWKYPDGCPLPRFYALGILIQGYTPERVAAKVFESYSDHNLSLEASRQAVRDAEAFFRGSR